jgi:hypothetical protein
VPGIYGKGDRLPERMANLVPAAAVSLNEVYEEIVKKGGHLFLSDTRSAEDQQRAHNDYIQEGRTRTAHHPARVSTKPPARSISMRSTRASGRMHRRILNDHGWVNIVDLLTASECWHHEFREDR